MDVFGIGSTELIVVMLIAVVILGPERLVKTAREAGRLVRNLKAYFRSFSDELKTELDVLDDLKELERDIKRDVSV